jgi:Dolichyl-phosphate-mannose-protein mannosyltransferase
MQPSPFPQKTTDTIALLLITLITGTAAFLAYSADDLPRIDDWTYAWSVEHFHNTGTLRLLDWSAHYPLAQLLWATGFTSLFGFSFAVLRVSTLVLEWLGLLAFYLTLRTLHLAPLPSALGTFALLFNPVFFVLGHSFMTDIPFVSMANMTILGYVLWAQQRRAVWLCFGGIFATLAFLIRQLGAGLPLLPLLYLLLSSRMGARRALSWPHGLCLLFPFLGMSLTLWWIRDIHGATHFSLARTQSFAYVFSPSLWFSSFFWWVYFQGFGDALAHLSLLLGPVAFASLWGRSRRFLLVAFALVVWIMGSYLWHFGALPPVFHEGELSVEELGLARRLLPDGEALHRPIPLTMAWVLWGLLLASGIAWVAPLLEDLWQRVPQRHRPSTIVLLHCLVQFAFIEVLWLYYDRYYLPLLPGLIIVLLRQITWTKVTQTVMVSGVLIFAAISVSGTIDNYRFHRTVAQARAWLLEQQVAPWDIDAGYVLNGWWLYAHPENLQPGASPEPDLRYILPHEFSSIYGITNGPIPSYRVIRVVAWQTLWAISNKVYILQRADSG